MHQMRAALYDRYGPPEVLREGRVAMPVMKPDEVLVRVHAASVNGGEPAGRAGKLRLITGRRFPQRTGIDFAGEITEVGRATTGVHIGDRVWGMMGRRFGSIAEYVAVRPRRISAAPENLTMAEAVSLPAGGTTSITALRDKARLRPGERLLVRGGSGGVGSVAVQIGKAYRAHVTALASAKHLDFVRGLGADEVLDYRMVELAGLGRFDVVMDTVGTRHRELRRLLAPGGRMVAIAFDLNRALAGIGYISASTIHGSARVRFFSGNPQHEMFAELAALARSGDIRPVVDTVHPLSGVADAHRALEAGGVRGKHIIQLV